MTLVFELQKVEGSISAVCPLTPLKLHPWSIYISSLYHLLQSDLHQRIVLSKYFMSWVK